MKRLIVFAVSAVILFLSLFSVTAQNSAPTTTRPTATYPPQVEPAIRAFIRFGDYQESMADEFITNYEFERGTDPNNIINQDCWQKFNFDRAAARNDSPLEYTGASAISAPYVNVTIYYKSTDGRSGEYRFRVSSDGQLVFYCGQTSFTPTPTLTPDLTRTTATPTFTPSRTPTITPTFTATLTPSATLTLTPSNTPTATYTLTPSVTPRFEDAVTCEGFLTSRLQVGEQGRVITDDPIRLRSSASTDGLRVALLNPNAVFDVLEGPECDPDAGRAWWRVNYSTFTGWLIEGEDEEYYTEPIEGSVATITPPAPRASRTAVPTVDGTREVINCEGFMPSRLVIGEMGRVLPGDANNVRDAASTSGVLLGKIPGEGEFIVVDGPECDPAGRAWWQVDYDGLVGWTVEGQGDEYYLEPITPDEE